MVNMSTTQAFHPKAFLNTKRNVKAGLISRSKILFALEDEGKAGRSAGTIARESGLSYECVAYHLKAMKREHLVDKFTKNKPFTWELTRFGQQKLLS